MHTLNVSHIQHFSIGDGPGIRTTVFLKGCPLHCPWCHNPETISPLPQTLFFASANKRVLYGKQLSIDEVFAQVMEDVPFYQSDGGVTISGGEPLLQSEGVAMLFSRLKEQGVSTLIDTAGDVPWPDIARVLPLSDWFYYDFKTGSEEKYAHVIGANGARVYENLCKLVEMGVPLHVRIPLIEGFNTSEQDIYQIIQKLKRAGVSCVDLLPFHRMASAKYAAMNKVYLYKDTPPQSKQQIQAIAALYQTQFQVSIE